MTNTNHPTTQKEEREPIESIIKGLTNWVNDRIDDLNTNYNGKSYLDAQVNAAITKSCVEDLSFLFKAVIKIAEEIKEQKGHQAQ